MPTYEFECEQCKYKFEEFLGISDMFNSAMNQKVKIRCPECKHTKVKLLIPKGNGFILNGSGFYANDYKGKK